MNQHRKALGVFSRLRFLLLLLLLSVSSQLLIITSSDAANVVDISSLTELRDQTFSQDTAISGRISSASSTKFLMSNLKTSSASVQVNISVTFEHDNSSLILEGCEFPSSLVIRAHLATATTKNVSIFIVNSSVSCGVTGTRCATTEDVFSNVKTRYALLVELAPLPLKTDALPPNAPVRRINTFEVGHISVHLEHSTVSFSETNRFSILDELIAFAVRNTTEVSLEFEKYMFDKPVTTTGKTGRGSGQQFLETLGLQPGTATKFPPVWTFTPPPGEERLLNAIENKKMSPHVSVFVRKCDLTCTSQRASITSSLHPDFVSCIAIGSGGASSTEYVSKQLIDKLRYRFVEHDVHLRYEVLNTTNKFRDLAFYAPKIEVTDSTFEISCAGYYAGCVGVWVNGLVFNKVSIFRNIITSLSAKRIGHGVAVVACHGGADRDSPVSNSVDGSSSSSSSSSSLPSPTDNTTTGNETHDDDADNHDDTDTFKPTIHVSNLETTSITQFKEATSYYGELSTVSILAIDVAITKVTDCTLKKANVLGSHSVMAQVYYLVNGEQLLLSNNTVVDAEISGDTYDVALFSVLYVENVKFVELSRCDCGSFKNVDHDSVFIRVQSARFFESVVVKEISKATIFSTDNDIQAIALVEMFAGRIVQVSDIKMTLDAGKVAVVVYFDEGLVSHVHEFVVDGIDVNIKCDVAGNVMNTNSTMRNVSLVVLRNVNAIILGRGQEANVFMCTFLTYGPKRLLIENVYMDFTGTVAAGMAFLTITNETRDGLDETFIVVRNLTGTCQSKSFVGAFALLSVVYNSYKRGYFIINTDWPELVPMPPITLDNVRVSTTGTMGGLFVLQNVDLESVVLRGGTELTTTANNFWWPLQVPFGPTFKGKVRAIDASGPICSFFNSKKLFGIPTIRQLTKLHNVRARHCGETYTQTQSVSPTWYFIPPPSRTPTNVSYTKTSTKTFSPTSTVSLLPPELDLEEPAAASAVGSFAATASLAGGAGATVALDAARAVAVLALASRCASYRKADYGLTTEERRRQFYDTYLKTKPKFPQKFFWFICFGDERGACIRGAVVSHLLFLTVITCISLWYGTKMFQVAAPTLSPAERGSRFGFIRFARLPFFVGMVFAFLIGPWTTQAVVMLSVPHLPDSDGILGVISVLLWFVIVIVGLVILYPRTNAKPIVWKLEESLVLFGTEEEEPTGDKSSFGKRILSAICRFTASKYGRWISLGDYVWTEVPAGGGAVQANGKPGSMLWNCGTIVNKYMGPYFIEQPLERRSKKRRKAERHMNYWKSDMGGVPTRRYHFLDWRLRIAPYTTFISIFWTICVCGAQGVVLSDPEQCTSAQTAIAALNILAFLTHCYLREYIVKFRTYATCCGSFFLAVGSSVAAFGDPEQKAVMDAAQTFVVAFLAVLTVITLINAFLKLSLYFGRGTVLLRSELLNRFEQLMEMERSLLGQLPPATEEEMDAAAAAANNADDLLLGLPSSPSSPYSPRRSYEDELNRFLSTPSPSSASSPTTRRAAPPSSSPLLMLPSPMLSSSSSTTRQSNNTRFTLPSSATGSTRGGASGSHRNRLHASTTVPIPGNSYDRRMRAGHLTSSGEILSHGAAAASMLL